MLKIIKRLLVGKPLLFTYTVLQHAFGDSTIRSPPIKCDKARHELHTNYWIKRYVFSVFKRDNAEAQIFPQLLVLVSWNGGFLTIVNGEEDKQIFQIQFFLVYIYFYEKKKKSLTQVWSPRIWFHPRNLLQSELVFPPVFCVDLLGSIRIVPGHD